MSLQSIVGVVIQVKFNSKHVENSLINFALQKLRDGVKKSKWKFKMAFPMKGGGSRVPHTYFEK